jgi:tetraacyldisaccharide 4'-kinase
MREPPFWWRSAGVEAVLLAPCAAIYGAVASRRMARAGARVAVPVVCIGNPTVGGAGKTPTALAVASMLKDFGERPAFLSRGYGGRLAGPLRVDPAVHHAADVGDEPLLLARAAPTIVARDRVRGAEAAIAAGASVVVMDDGFQNPSLAKDFPVLLVDARRGIGNGCVIPAGPLRAPLDAQLARAQALILVGDGAVPEVEADAARRVLPVFRARLVPDATTIAALRGHRALALAGIGDPEKFFATLREAGIAVAAARSFPDHHRYRAADADTLCKQAERDGLALITTEKDLARMQGDAAAAQLAARARALPVTLMFEDDAGFRALLRQRLSAARAAAR